MFFSFPILTNSRNISIKQRLITIPQHANTMRVHINLDEYYKKEMAGACFVSWLLLNDTLTTYYLYLKIIVHF